MFDFLEGSTMVPGKNAVNFVSPEQTTESQVHYSALAH
jgi:hypothetical protein